VLNYFPKYFTNKAITLYICVLVLCNIVFFIHALPIMFWIFGIVEVLCFFYFSNIITRKWSEYSLRKFSRNLFLTAFIVRIIWVIFSYFFYNVFNGQPFEFDAADALNYHDQGLWVAQLINEGSLQLFVKSIRGGYSDMGYPFYLGCQYWFTDGSILIARFLKAIYGAYTCVLIYRFAKNNFGEEVGRIASIFCMLMPNLILYTGMHLKETEMILLIVWFIERSDFLLRGKKFNFINIAPPIMLALSLFFLRTVLGAAAIFALFTALLFSSNHVLNLGKRTVLVVWMVGTVGFFIGGRVATEVEAVWAARSTNQEKGEISKVKANKLSKYASGAVFAPLIFVIPFPTMVDSPGQRNQKLIHGGNYVKNIMAFFVIFAFYWILKNKKWRDYLLLEAFTLGYLLVIAMSTFAESERFHLPAVPFLMIFAAFGISKITNKEKKYFKWYLVFIFLAVVGWNWFKLAGRGLI